MLEKIDLSKKFGTKEYKDIMGQLEPELSLLQRKCKEENIPVLIVFEGWGASGKGTLINKLIAPLDPRGFQVFTVQSASEESALRPYMWRFWTKTPVKGRIHVLDGSWYRGTEAFGKNDIDIGHLLSFEEELIAEGTVIIKFFLHISKKEQRKRFEKLEETKKTSWRVTKEDWKQNKKYELLVPVYDTMIARTDTEFAPWTIIEAMDEKYATAKIIKIVIERLEEALEKSKLRNEFAEEKTEKQKESIAEDFSLEKINESLKLNVLSNVDLNKKLEKGKYKKKLIDLQERLEILHFEMYKRRIPVILAFEGWDAAGKGGAIKRITEHLDPRGYAVNPISAPNDIERAHHYLWRFWNSIPKAGHLAIFDRTWYGRVMVERIEGFCKEHEWKRAYNEINDMEANLTDYGCIVLKYWLHINKEEQFARFTERKNNPEKNWKITEEDWRNREKWDQYEEVVNEMIIKTSTPKAPWIIVEGNDKHYARVKILESIVQVLEERMLKK